MATQRRKRTEPEVRWGWTANPSGGRFLDDHASIHHELDGELAGWTLEAEFRLIDGEVVHGPVRFLPPETPAKFGSLSQTALRRIGMHEVMGHVELLLGQMYRESGGAGDWHLLGKWLDALKAGRRPGRRGQDPRFYLLWAQRRVDAQQHAPDRPIKWLVEQFGDLYSENAITEYVRAARDKRLLTRTRPPELTALARRMLEKETGTHGEH